MQVLLAWPFLRLEGRSEGAFVAGGGIGREAGFSVTAPPLGEMTASGGCEGERATALALASEDGDGHEEEAGGAEGEQEDGVTVGALGGGWGCGGIISALGAALGMGGLCRQQECREKNASA